MEIDKHLSTSHCHCQAVSVQASTDDEENKNLLVEKSEHFSNFLSSSAFFAIPGNSISNFLFAAPHNSEIRF